MKTWFEKKFNKHSASLKKIWPKNIFPKFNLSYSNTIILINVLFFIFVIILMNLFDNLNIFSWVALNPSKILSGKTLWTFVTSMFMHGGFGHLFANMISLMFIGNFVEKLIGKKRFLGLYFVGGLFAALFFILISFITKNGLDISIIGASGAIFALGGLLAVLTPKLPVLVFFVIPLPMWAAMVFLMFGLWAISNSFGLPIGNIAHLGGLIVGVSYGLFLKKKYPGKTKMISKYFTR